MNKAEVRVVNLFVSKWYFCFGLLIFKQRLGGDLRT